MTDAGGTFYDRTGSSYDATRRADPYIAGRLVHHLRPRPGGVHLDVGCGTGNYAAALAAAGVGGLLGLDRSAAMVRRAAGKGVAGARWCVADAAALPLADGRAGGAVCTLAVHHFADLGRACREVGRVLRPGGRFVVFTATRRQMRGCWLNAYFPRAVARAIDQMPDFDALAGALAAGGFDVVGTEPYDVRDDLQDLFMYAGKHRPHLYLDPRVRAGISAFAALADPAEVADGCRRLAADLAAGRFDDVRRSYRHDAGDYLFVVAERRQP